VRRLLVLILAAACAFPQLAVQAAVADAAPLTVSSFAGGGVGDNGAPGAAAIGALGIVLRPDGGYYVSDAVHNRVRAVSAAGSSITTYAGSGEQTEGLGGFSGDGGQAMSAQLFNPRSLALYPNGDLAFIDYGNHRVRMVSAATGVITTIAGNGRLGAVGTASPSSDATSQPLDPRDLAYDPAAGTLDIADGGGERVWARHGDGSLALLAGSGPTFPGDGGDPTAARLLEPAGLAVEPNGDLLISETGSGRIRQIHAGVINTVAGLADASDGTALHATLFRPSILRIRNDGLIFAATDAGTVAFQVGGSLDHYSAQRLGGFDPTGHLLTLAGAVMRESTIGQPQADRLIGNLGALSYPYALDVTVSGQGRSDAPLEPTGGLLTVGTDTYVTNEKTLDRIDDSGKVFHALGDAPATDPTSSSNSLTNFLGLVPAPGEQLLVNNGGHLFLLDPKDNSVVAYSGQRPSLSAPVEGEGAADLSYVGPMTSNAAGDVYFGAGRTLAVLLRSSKTVHVLTPDIQELGGSVPNYLNAETIRSVAITPDGKLLVLSDEGTVTYTSGPISSRVRLVDPADGNSTTLYCGPQLQALTIGPDGRMFVAEPTDTHGIVIDELGTGGSTARIAGGGHITGASQSATDLYLQDVSGLAIGGDGSLLIASPRARRVLSVPVSAGFTAPPSVTNLQVTSAPGWTGYQNQTLSWDLPAALPAGSHIEGGFGTGAVTGPQKRDRYGNFGTNSSTNPIGREAGSRWVYSIYVVSAQGEQSAPMTLTSVVPGDTTAPEQIQAIEGFSNDSNLIMTWGASTSKDVAAYQIRLAAGATAPSSSATPTRSSTATNATLTNLVVGQSYTLLFSVQDYSGNTSSFAVPFVAGRVPDGQLDGPAPAENGFSGPSVTFYPDTTTRFSGGFTCTLDARPLGCSGGAVLNDLAAGPHTFTFLLRTTLGDGPTLTRHFTVDRTAPALTVTSPEPFTLAPSVALTWKGTDTGSGIASYRYRYQRAAATSAFGPFTMPSTTTAAKATVALAPGYTYCFQVQAVDKVGNTSPYGPSRCTTRPLDDTGLATSKGWTRSRASAYYGSTIVQTKTKGAQLATRATFRQLALVVMTCPSCGTVNVYSGSSLLKTINLTSSTTRRQVLIALPVVNMRTATITVRATSTNKTVAIDGLGISRA